MFDLYIFSAFSVLSIIDDGSRTFKVCNLKLNECEIVDIIIDDRIMQMQVEHCPTIWRVWVNHTAIAFTNRTEWV